MKKKHTGLTSPFITAYLVGGYPTKEKSIEIMQKAVRSGLNAIEIGFPSSNPFLDGDMIQRAHKQIYDDFSSLDDFIDYLHDVRAAISIPIWIMGYTNDLFHEDAYLKLANSTYIDGFIIPDLKIAQTAVVQQHLNQTAVNVIPVINNEMTDEDIHRLAENKEVIYCQLYAGKTGHELTITENLPEFYKRMRKITDAKLMAGFGIKNQDIAEKIFEVGYDGIVVGSEFVRLVATENEAALHQFIDELVQSKKKWG